MVNLMKLVGKTWGNTWGNTKITNCYSNSEVSGYNNTGGLVGEIRDSGTVSNSYATGSVSGSRYTGGLVGWMNNGTVSKCYATGSVTGTNYNTGGLVGVALNSFTINDSFATGEVKGNNFNGGLIGSLETPSGTATITNSYATGEVNGTRGNGSLIGKLYNTADKVTFGTINITDCLVIEKETNVIGGVYTKGDKTYDYDMTGWLNEIAILKPRELTTQFQVGINGDENSQIRFDTNFKFDFNSLTGGIEKVETLNAIMEFSKALDKKQTELGSLQNRFYSALDAAAVSIETLTSARSTIKDTDVAKENSRYIRNQILQQAGATLLSTANQTPAIALALLQNAQLRRKAAS